MIYIFFSYFHFSAQPTSVNKCIYEVKYKKRSLNLVVYALRQAKSDMNTNGLDIASGEIKVSEISLKLERNPKQK